MPRILPVLGAAGFGTTPAAGMLTDPSMQRRVIGLVRQYGGEEIDTARRYGESELALGAITTGLSMRIDSKVFPMQPGWHGGDHLERVVRESIDRLKVDSLDILYLHAPDRSTPFEETVEKINDIHKMGLFRRFGLSNFASWEVSEIVQHCRYKGYIQPTVYQGMYNALTRNVESELLPCLRKFGIAFYAFSPMAGGFLTGKITREGNSSRFDASTRQGKMYQSRFFHKSYFQAMEVLKSACEKEGIDVGEASLRWFQHHSAMSPSDRIIIGVSKIEHAESNLSMMEKGPLSEAIVTAFEEAWDMVQGDSPNYYVTFRAHVSGHLGGAGSGTDPHSRR